MYMHVCSRVYVHMHACSCARAQVRVCMRGQVHACQGACVPVHARSYASCTRARASSRRITCVYVYVCVNECVSTLIYVYVLAEIMYMHVDMRM